MATARTDLVKVALDLKDQKGQSITTRTEIVITEEVSPSPHVSCAEGKAGEVTHFSFELQPGIYAALVQAEGYQVYNQMISLSPDQEEATYEFMLSLEDPSGEKGEGDAKLLAGRFAWFAEQRTYPGKEFPSDGREKALKQKQHMDDPDVTNAKLKIEHIKNPLPNSSFGSIERYVRVDAQDEEHPFQRAILKIPYADEDLGWVDAASLRVFEVDAQARAFNLIEESGVNRQRNYAFAYIEKPGIYGVIGLPKDPAILGTLRIFCELQAQLLDEQHRGVRTLHDQICQLILCQPVIEIAEAVKHSLLVLPGRIEGDSCSFCTSITTPDSGLPECRLLSEPPGPVVVPGCNWISVGPRNVNGRIRALAMHPTDGNTVYVGSANGGVWVTHDSGLSWKPLMHDEGALEIGALAVHLTDPANPAGPVTVYAGTGEPTYWPGYKGIGVLKSTANGDPGTWNATGALPAPGNDRFSVILIDPTSVTSNPATTVVYAGGPRGLYKSANGGNTWALMLGKNITGLATDPTNPTILYAAVAYEGIYKFNPTTSMWNTFNTGLAASFPLLISIAIGQSAPHTMYAKLDQTVYVYNTASASWQSLGAHGGITYGYWNNVLGVDPVDSNIVFAGGIVMERSANGGTTWQSTGSLHYDQHALVFDSTNHSNVFVGDDGGIFQGVYPTATSAGTWTKVSDGLVLTQFNQVGMSSAGPDIFGGGTQDNGTIRTVGGLTWDPILGADGGDLVIDPANPYILYAEVENGGIQKSIDGGASFTTASSGFPGGPWVTPIVLDPNSLPEPNRVLFAGGNSQVYRTTNSAGIWSPSSPNIGGSILTIAIAPASSAIVYAGTSWGKVWRSSDSGATMANWKNITIGTITGSKTLPTRGIAHLAVHPADPDIVYLAFSGFGSATPTTPGHVFRGTSTDGWITWKWEDISSNLPDIPANAVAIDLTSPNIIYIGTDIGVFWTADGGLSWSDFGAGLPNVVISDLALNATGDVLRAATYGYGMFERRLALVCPDVDVYMRDNKLDTGETFPSPSGVDPTTLGSYVWWWQSADIKIDSHPYGPVLLDGVEFDLTTSKDVVRNDWLLFPYANRLYVQVHNRGPRPAHNVRVKVLWADASAALPPLPDDFWTSYPNDWSASSAWNTVDAAVPFQVIPELLPETPKILLWYWVVPFTAADHVWMLAVISADEDPVAHSDANPNDHLVWVIVPNDKHATLRHLHVIYPPPPIHIPLKTTLDFYNPFRYPQFFDIIIDDRSLPEGSKLSLLLPKVQTELPTIHGHPKGITVSGITGQEPWRNLVEDSLAGELRDGFHIAVDKEHNDDDDEDCRKLKLVRIPHLFIPANGKLRATLIISPPPQARPGSKYEFTIMQNIGDTVIGGSTFEVRIPAAEVGIHECSKQ
jgi:hypothetical protein